MYGTCITSLVKEHAMKVVLLVLSNEVTDSVMRWRSVVIAQ